MQTPSATNRDASGAEAATSLDERTTRSPDTEDRLRIEHASVDVELPVSREAFFDAYSGLLRYDEWAPEVQGAGHWLVVREGGPGSRFVVYDKPGERHLVHFGVVTRCDRPRRFAWSAPFSEWPRATLGTVLELEATQAGGIRARETLFFEAREDHLPALGGFLALDGYDRRTFERFLRARLQGLGRLLAQGRPRAEPADWIFGGDTVVAADWAGRVAEKGWVRVLFADGEIDFSAPPEIVFNAFTRFARYPDWTRRIHVGAEWLDIRAGGVGSKFLLWEKPGDRQVMHQAVVTECDPPRRFTWRAPFAEWGKVFLGTSMMLEPAAGGGSHAYHVLYADLPEEYLPLFGGFGVLPGFDLEFETLHIHEEARGFERLLQQRAFQGADTRFLFDVDRTRARDWPLQEGRRWPEEAQTLVPDRVILYEDFVVELATRLAEATPRPAFLRKHRDLARTRRFNRLDGPGR
jgi:uncharacterized protein YndB with AHSA1/START domain